MKLVMAVLGWVLFLVVQSLSVPVFSVPVKSVKVWKASSRKVSKLGLTKSPPNTEQAQKKSSLKKKTSISVNGQLLPLAALEATDKNIHVTVQNSEPNTAGQLNQLSPPQVSVQELSLGNTNVPGSLVNTAGQQGQATFNSPPNLGLSNTQGVANAPTNLQGQFHSPPNLQNTLNFQPNVQGQGLGNQGPFHSPSNLQGSLGSQTGSQSTNTFHSPPNLGGQGQFHSPPNLGGQGQFHSPPNLGEQGQLHLPLNIQSLNKLPGQTSLNTQPQGQGTDNPVNKLAAIGLSQSSDGQLTYKPFRS